MTYGAFMQSADHFKHGYLLETAFEIYDYIAMLIPLYPYRSDNIKQDLKGAMCFHHAPSIVSAYLIFETGLYENTHLQWVAVSLLLGGAVSCILGVVSYFFDLHTLQGTRIITAITVINTIFFVFCRFGIFPVESYRLMRDVQGHPDLLQEKPWAMYVLVFDAVVYSIFNSAIMIDLLPKLFLWLRRSVDGTTSIQDSSKPIGSSRDSILGHNKKRASKRFSAFILADHGAAFEGLLDRQSLEGTTTGKKKPAPLITLSEDEQELIDSEDSEDDDTKKTK